MNNFFQLIYDRAAETHSLGLDCDHGYRRAHAELSALIEPLHLAPEEEEKLMNAAYGLSYFAGISCLSYGFRLAVQVIRPVGPVYPTRA